MAGSKTRNTQMFGTRANQSSASSVHEGALYFVTDEGAVEISDGSAWQPWAIGDTGLEAIDHGDVTFGGTGSMTFTVSSGELLRYNVQRIGKRWLLIDIGILAADVGGTPSTGLQITVPGYSLGPTDTFGGNGVASDDAFATQDGCQVITRESGGLVEIKKLDGSNWASGTGTMSLFITIIGLLEAP